MSSRLDEILDWDERLRAARWQVKKLAANCNIGEWELRHYIRLKFKLPPHVWIRNKRIEAAKALLREGMPVKEAGLSLGYKPGSHFTHDFKGFCGISPSVFRHQSLESRQDHRF